ncbi:hypothetical protein [Chryseobacterium gossypii]|uniref:hypothetical protein n=1 Tax=Chryseobacterium gossypii TaxID=3231602 RepID=UPI0035255111
MVNQKFYSIVCYLLLSILLISCSQKLNPNSAFGYKDLTDSYDSKTSLFTRDYGDDIVKVKITLRQDEKEKIIKTFSENRFQNLPSEIDCSRWGFHPQIYDELFLDNYSVKYIHNSEDRWLCPSGKRFDKIHTVMRDIILNKPEIKKLEPSDIAYE